MADYLLHDTTCHTLAAFVPNLIILSQVVAEKSLTEDLQMHYIGVRDGKIEKNEKEGKINICILIFCYTIYLANLKVFTKFENPDSNRS